MRRLSNKIALPSETLALLVRREYEVARFRTTVEFEAASGFFSQLPIDVGSKHEISHSSSYQVVRFENLCYSHYFYEFQDVF